MRKRVYIAGPISKGDLAHNIRQAEAAFFALLRADLAPFCPHWSCYSTGPKVAPGYVYAVATAKGGGGCGHAEWLGVDLAWVRVYDALLRLPGESTGADQEVACAQFHGKPVFESVEAVIRWAQSGA